MATVTAAVVTTSSSNTNSYTSGAFTPAAGDLLVAFVVATATVAAGGMTDTQSLGWTKITTATKASGADTLYLFVSNALAAASSTTVTFTCTGDNATGTVISVARVAGVARVGSAAVRQSAVQNNGAAAGTPAPVFGSAALTTNPCLGVVGNATNAAGLTAPTGWTERSDTGYTLPTTGSEYVSRDSGFTGTTVTWGSTSASAFGAIVVEIDSSNVGTATITQAGDTSSATGTVQVKGTATITQAGDTSSATGTVQVKGVANVTQEGDAVVATGTVADAAIQGTANITQAGDTVSAAGTVQVKGAATITQAGDTVAAAGTVQVQGTANITQGGDSVAATGTVQVQGVANITQAGDTVVAAGTVQVQGTATITQTGDTSSATGTVQVKGVANVTQEGDTVVATGTVGNASPILGVANITQEGDTVVAAGTVSVATPAAVVTGGAYGYDTTRDDDRPLRETLRQQLLREDEEIAILIEFLL